MAPPARYSQAYRDRLSGRLLVLLREFGDREAYPSVRVLCDRLAEGEDARPNDYLVRELRDDLEDLGLWARPAYWPQGTVRGLDGSTAASRKAIEDRWLEVQAEKEARGEPYAVPTPPVEVLRSRDYRLRENRR